MKGLGGDGTTTASGRSAEQTEIALFWVESPALQWNRIARTVATSRGLNLWKSARLYALLDMGLVDAVIASWDTKYLYNHWRPITAIQNADTDGNANTTADPTWSPLVITPPFPEYDSVHAVQSAAAGDVLKRVLGTDIISFKTCSSTLPVGSTCSDASPKLRQFTSFTQAANEAGIARSWPDPTSTRQSTRASGTAEGSAPAPSRTSCSPSTTRRRSDLISSLGGADTGHDEYQLGSRLAKARTPRCPAVPICPVSTA